MPHSARTDNFPRVNIGKKENAGKTELVFALLVVFVSC